MPSKILTGSVVFLWAIGLYVGGWALNRHQWTPGLGAAAPSVGKFDTQGVKGTMLVFVHPECPCSHATLAELGRIEAAAGDGLRTTIYFYQPAGRAVAWCMGALWQQAAGIPGVETCLDPEGRMAAKYGAHVSGQVLVYSGKTNRLVFSGGITDGRGHEGDNPGEYAILAFIEQGSDGPTTTPVYGCVIQ